ncbi:hypothetical protein [Rothia uropygialis]|uniref:hypothetical protein n=1 Tax=Kocuria sp. 36 TaxID=1415402 RepID=UPI00101C34BD|nr:hypothetical protein [Kocuria sp. 36]
MTRSVSDDARPVHVVQSKYQVTGEKYARARHILHALSKQCEKSTVWESYSATLRKLEETLAPKVAKELLDAYIQQYNLA